MSRLLTILLICLSSAGFLGAQKQVYNTSRVSGEEPVIDGRLDDPAWEQVEWSDGFTQIEPFENRPPSQQTRFRILYDENNLYVAIRAFDSAPDSIEKRMSRRDGFAGDWVEINVDSYHDLLTAFSFSITAAGVKGDEAISNDDQWDTSWDPIWYAKTAIDDRGWTAEMRIPFTQLRFGKQDEYVWGLQVNRRFFRKEERSSWVFIPQNASGWVHYFGELHGIRNIRPQKQKDITPYVLGRFEHYEKEDGNPFSDGNDLFGTVGVDGKFGITNDLTLDFTINPDFGQVEADPSQVNLTTYETYFRERRPFFIEGNNILNFRLTRGGSPLSRDNLFYSRRIGAPPSYWPDLEDDEYEKRKDNTTILGAFKLTGKTRKGWSIGIMESITQREYSVIDLNGEQRKEEIEPFTNYFTARLQKDMNKSNTRLGGMITTVNRDLSNPDLENNMHRSAYSGGIDFNHEWKDKTYYIYASAAFSQVRGNREAIYETQTNAPHFFQRPDADYFHVDSSRTQLSGFGGTIQHGKAGGGKWMYATWLTWRSPGFNLNDIGYMRRNDEAMEVIWFGFRQNEPFSIFRSVRLNFNQWYGFTFDPGTRYYGGNFNAHTEFKNYWETGFGTSREGKSISTETLRGGPSLVYDGHTNFFSYISSDNRKKIQFIIEYFMNARDHKTARRDNVFIDINYQVSDALRISLSPSFMKRRDKIQYVSNVEYLDDMRYVRGNLDQSQMHLTLRLSYNITPDFTIQYYGMPFISAGKYNEFKYINDPLADDFGQRYVQYREDRISYDITDDIYEIDETGDGTVDYTFDNPDFNVKDFNSNLVVRWEYQPGSTVYLVWSRQRNDEVTDGNFHIWNDSRDLFKIYPYDIFLIKFSYRFAL
jgi:hypothetical protein